MTKIILRTEINAPVERCFDLSRSIDLHQKSTAQTKERAIAGRTSGLIELGETVTWRAKHFGFWQELTSKISAFNYPNTFTDEMVKGIFKRIHHVHRFVPDNQKTIMIDEFTFELPAGFVGRFVSFILIKGYLKNLLIQRNKSIKAYAEGDEWKKYIPEA